MKRLHIFAGFIIVVVSLAAMPACVNRGPAGGGGSVTPDPQTQLVTGCYTDQAPQGYLRIDSRDSELPNCKHDIQFNVYVYTPYKDLSVGSELKVCAGDPLPDGWQKWSLPFRDEAGCDSSTPAVKNDPQFQNEITFKRTM